MEATYKDDRRIDDPYRESAERAQSELDELCAELARVDAHGANLRAKIEIRQAFLRAAAEMLKDSAPARKPALSAIQDVAADPEVGKVSFASVIALKSLPREGYGVITKAVLRLLNFNPQGVSAKMLALTLQRNGFRAKGADYEAAVRSALKNLRTRNLVAHNEDTGRYQSTHAVEMLEARSANAS